MENNITPETKPTSRALTPRKSFWLRFVAWIMFAVVAPCGFIVWRFGLFAPAAEPKIIVGGWGVLVILMVSIFSLVLVSYIKQGLKGTYYEQLVSGFTKLVLPLLITYALLYIVRNSVDLFLNVLGVIIACEIVAVPINPMPEWLKKHRTEETENMIDVVLDRMAASRRGKRK